MITRRSVAVCGLAGWAAGAGLPGLALAQNSWPTKPVRIVVPYQAGGTADSLGRLFAHHFHSVFQQSFVVENRGGAAGLVGSQQVARQAPDGYQLLVSGLGSHVIAPLLAEASFDPMKDFTHIAMLGGPPTTLLVNAESPIRTLADFIAAAKRPQSISWGSPGRGTHGHLIGELFNSENKLDMVHVTYKGASPALVDLAGNQLQAAFVTLSSAGAFVKQGKLRALASTTAKRVPAYPDVPTFAELGYPKLTANSWFSLSGPAGMPDSIVALLNAEVRRAFGLAEVRNRLAGEAIETNDMDAAQFTQFFKSQIEFWTPLVKSLTKSR